MVYEYCDEIKNSGIVHVTENCNSYVEMGIMTEADFTRTMNNIFHEAGVVELNQYKKGTITEASEKLTIKSVGEKIVKALLVVWEKIKGIFEKIINTINKKIDEFKNKFGESFAKINLNDYKEKLDKSLDTINCNYLGVFIDGNLDAAEKKVDNIGHSLGDTLAAKMMKNGSGTEGEVQAANSSYGLLLSKAFGDKKLVESVGASIEEAKKAIDEKIGLGKKDYNVQWIFNNQAKIASMIKADIIKDTKKGYVDCKKAADKAVRELKKVGTDDSKDFMQGFSKSTVAYLNTKLYFAELRVKALHTAIMIASRCVLTSKLTIKKKEDKVKTESALKFDKDFVNEAFNW